MLQTELRKPCSRAATIESWQRAVERVITSMHAQMDDRHDDPLSLRELADIAFLSPYHFNRIFRQVTGIPPTQFQYALRIEAAKRLLLTTRLSVTDVCFEVGYSSLGTFTMRFTKLVGLTPRSLRQLASRFDPSAHKVTVARWQRARPRIEDAADGDLRGRVSVPEGFDGLIFVGLFDTLIPQGHPVSCALLTEPGAYHLEPVPDGQYHLFAVGLRWSDLPREYLLGDSALRAHAGPLDVCRGQPARDVALSLRAPRLTDPPILLALPLLLSVAASRQAVAN